MWRSKVGAAVFVPHTPLGSRLAHSQKLLEAPIHLRIRGTMSMRPLTRSDGRSGAKLSGSLTLSGPHARVMFRKGAGAEPDVVSAPLVARSALLPASPRVPIPEHTVVSRFSSPLFIWISFRDMRGGLLGGRCCFGRVEQEVVRAEPIFESPARLSAWLNVRDVDVRRGPLLDVRGDVCLEEGVFMRVSMAQACDVRGEPQGPSETAEIPVIPAGLSVPIPKQEMSPGVGDSPWVSVAFPDGNGGATLQEVPVGRCMRLDG
jgi:hypothetical protein